MNQQEAIGWRERWARFVAFVRALGPGSVLAAGAAILPAVGGVVLLRYINRVSQWLESHGQQGVALYVAAFAILAGLAVLPTYSAAILGGWAFGIRVGLPAAMAGFLLGALIGYAVARPTAAARVEKILAVRPAWKAVRDALVGGTWWKTVGIVTLLRLPPNSPFAMTNLVLASVRVPLSAYLLGTLLGMLPRTALVLALAAKLREKFATAEEAAREKPWWLIPVGIVLTFVILGVIGAVAKRGLAKMTENPGR